MISFSCAAYSSCASINSRGEHAIKMNSCRITGQKKHFRFYLTVLSIPYHLIFQSFAKIATSIHFFNFPPTSISYKPTRNWLIIKAFVIGKLGNSYTHFVPRHEIYVIRFILTNYAISCIIFPLCREMSERIFIRLFAFCLYE